MTEREQQAHELLQARYPNEALEWEGLFFSGKENWLRVRDAAESLFKPDPREPFGAVTDKPLSKEEIDARVNWALFIVGCPDFAEVADTLLEYIHLPVPDEHHPKKQSIILKYGISDEDLEILRKELDQ